MVLDGFDCDRCYSDIQRERGCSLRGVPAPQFSRSETRYCGGVQVWFDCPTALKTPEHQGLFRLYQHYRDGRPIYSSVLDYPNRLLRQLEVLDSEVRRLELQKAKEHTDG